MPGFYVNHLKSERARAFAPVIEQRLRNPQSNIDLYADIIFENQSANDLRDTLSAAYAVHRDTPELFYYSTAFTAREQGRKISLSPTPLYSFPEIVRLKGKLEVAISEVLSHIDRTASLWEQERQIFQYMQTHIAYADDGARERHSIVGPLLEHKSVCEGISKMFAVLCHRIGIPCIVVFDENHMWNMVNMHGCISHVDATYGTGIGGICDYTYFNVSDQEVRSNHGKEIDCVPVCTSNLYDYYHQNGVYFETERELKHFLKRELLSGKQIIHAKLGTGDIERIINEVSLFSMTSFQYIHNEYVNTALIMR